MNNNLLQIFHQAAVYKKIYQKKLILIRNQFKILLKINKIIHLKTLNPWLNKFNTLNLILNHMKILANC